MNFTRMSTIIEDDDDDVEVLHSNWSPNNNPPSPPQNPGMEGASSARCISFDDLIRDKKVKSPSATHLFEDDRVDSLQAQVESKSKEVGHSSPRAKGQKRKGSHKSSKGGKKKKTGSLDMEGESVEEAFLALTRRLQRVELRTERAKLEEESALLEEERARSARLEEEGKRKVTEEALGQAEESARAKEEAFPTEATDWATRHHLEVARSILTTPEETIDFFNTMYKEPEGKRMITKIGSYGFQCGQKDERSLLYARLQKRDPSFDPAKMKLPALYKEEPTPPFPLQ
ncbi:unnamed protein product [Cuscuta campestris]|uniref:Uncharacterized protein n=1 Tax=Cuscuta campestris TaxID=132261 RepID=A0A484KZ29_9ASTE|nr:unnamed protein product [Cuscuta campestris]